MPGFIRNSWYCAGWSSELTDVPLGRRIIGDYVVMYRTEQGQAVALSGRCPHRFAPLDQGKIVGDQIVCPYHGLRYDSQGRCALNPYGDIIPERAKLEKYILLERNKVLWIWMGQPDKADESLLPDDGWLSAPDYISRTTYLNIPANYQLVIDNLLDLTHAPYLHPNTLFSAPEKTGKIHHTFGAEGQGVYSNYHCESRPRTGIQKNVFPDEFGESFISMQWRPASTLSLMVEIHPIGGGRKGGVHMPTAHYLTPETETTTHYFVGNGRDVKIDDEAESDFAIGLLYKAFKEEDEPMVKACQDMMGTTDLFSLGPVILPSDTPAVMARRRLLKLLAEEAAASNAAV